MVTLQELLAQKEALDRQIEEITTKGRAEAIEQVRALMAENGLSLADLNERGPSRKKSGNEKSTSGTKVAAKYRNTSTGETWSGRGLQPRWLKAALEGGKKIDEFAV